MCNQSNRSTETWQKIHSVFDDMDVTNPNFMRPFMSLVEANLPSDSESKQVFYSRIITEFTEIVNAQTVGEIIFVAHGEVRRAIQSGLGNVSTPNELLLFGNVLEFTQLAGGIGG